MSSASSSDASTPASHVYRGLINSVEGQVVDAMEGLLLTNPHLNKLDGGRDIKVLLRADWNAEATPLVSLISGGGDGHAPAHAGFVGANMLTAAVSGEVFASPSVKAILAAIRAVTRSDAPLLQGQAAGVNALPSPGCLLIVKNYTGDRLNFGLAMTQAILEGIPVSMVIVGDDVTLPRSKGVTGRRGIAGTVLVHKIAGAAAAAGKSLQDVTAVAQHVAGSLVSIGVATSTCSVPGNPVDLHRLPLGRMEIGIGIHGEQGMQQLPLESAREVVKRLVDLLLSRDPDRDYFFGSAQSPPLVTSTSNVEVVLLVNNLGGATATELNIFVIEALNLLRDEHGLVVRRVLAGTFMSALNMSGLSLTLLRVHEGAACSPEEQLAWLDMDVGGMGWPKYIAQNPHLPISLPVPQAPSKKSQAEENSADASASTAAATAAPSVVNEPLLTALAQTILDNAAALNALDARSGDGDCGSTLALGARALLDLLGAAAGGAVQHVRRLSQLLQILAEKLGESMGGSSGGLVQILLTAAAAAAKAQESAADQQQQQQGVEQTPLALRFFLSLEVGLSTVTRIGGATEGDRTFIDALAPAVRAFKESRQSPSHTAAAALQKAAEAAREGANYTRGLVGRAGRANYVVGADALSEADPGAEAVALLLEAAAKQQAAGASSSS